MADFGWHRDGGGLEHWTPRSSSFSVGTIDREGDRKKLTASQVQWLTSVIPATWEAEIRRIRVQSQPPTIYKTLSRKYPRPKGVVEWLKR
jgi:hypothetical protein